MNFGAEWRVAEITETFWSTLHRLVWSDPFYLDEFSMLTDVAMSLKIDPVFQFKQKPPGLHQDAICGVFTIYM